MDEMIDFEIKTIDDIDKYLSSFLHSRTSVKYAEQLGVDRIKYLLKLLDSPQEKIKTIHIAGTSGKGSVTTILSNLLIDCGFKVGSNYSPHLIDKRERFLINQKFISNEEFINYLNQIRPSIKETYEKFGFISYFEIMTVLGFFIYFDKKVDYAVVETGLGGLYDATNVIDNSSKVSIITRLGLDHTEVLGKKIEEIAFHKAAIINSDSFNIILNQGNSSDTVIQERIEKTNSKCVKVIPDKSFTNIVVNSNFTQFDFTSSFGTSFKEIKISLLGSYQAENASLAIETLLYLSKRDVFEVNEKIVRECLLDMSYAGRFDKKLYKSKEIILDGAHNPQKMRGFIESLKRIYPDKKFDFLIAFKNGKDYGEMISEILPVANSIITTSFSLKNADQITFSENAEEIKKVIENQNSEVTVESIVNTKEALENLTKKNGINIITGSIYLLGNIYEIIDEEVL